MNFQFSPELDKNKIFLVNRRELEERLDPHFYKPFFRDIVLDVGNIRSEKLGNIARFTDESWDQKGFFKITFPYIEIGEIDLSTGEIKRINKLTIEKAPSRAKMIVRNSDILVSKTRPNRGAISFIDNDGVFIASTGFSVIRGAKNSAIDKRYLFYWLRQNRSLWQMEQRSSGGNYPAITQEELSKINIPIPPQEIQAQIVTKMDAAYATKKQKETERQRLLDSIDDYLLGELGIKLPEQDKNMIGNRIFFRYANTVSGYRLDPNTYKKERLDAIKSIKQGIYVSKPLHQVVKHKREKISDFAQGTTYIGLENIESNTGEWIPSESIKSISSAAIFGKDDILFPKLRPYLNKVFYSDTEGLCSTEFHVFRSYFENNSYIANFLRSKVVVAQTRNLMSGNTLPRLQFEDIQKLLIPIPTLKKQTEIANHITEVRNQTKQLREEAKKEVEQAKKEVEMMILGEDTSKAWQDT